MYLDTIKLIISFIQDIPTLFIFTQCNKELYKYINNDKFYLHILETIFGLSCTYILNFRNTYNFTIPSLSFIKYNYFCSNLHRYVKIEKPLIYLCKDILIYYKYKIRREPILCIKYTQDNKILIIYTERVSYSKNKTMTINISTINRLIESILILRGYPF